MLVILKCEEYDSGKCFGALRLCEVWTSFSRVCLRKSFCAIALKDSKEWGKH